MVGVHYYQNLFNALHCWALQVADDLDPTSALLESFQNIENSSDVSP